jgi:hypothetical protein
VALVQALCYTRNQMEEGKQATAAVGASSSGGTGMMPAGMRPGSGPRRAKLKLLGLIVGVVVLLLAVGAGSYLLLHKSSNKNSTTSVTATGTNKVPAYFSTLNSQEQVDYYLTQKNYTAAEDIYDGQLKVAKTADARAQANMGLCGIYTTEHAYQSAYQYALKAYGNEVTPQTATTAAGAAVNAGDKTAAATYYQTAINLLPKENLPSDQYAYNLRELQADLQEAGQ